MIAVPAQGISRWRNTKAPKISHWQWPRRDTLGNIGTYHTLSGEICISGTTNVVPCGRQACILKMITTCAASRTIISHILYPDKCSTQKSLKKERWCVKKYLLLNNIPWYNVLCEGDSRYLLLLWWRGVMSYYYCHH